MNQNNQMLDISIEDIFSNFENISKFDDFEINSNFFQEINDDLMSTDPTKKPENIINSFNENRNFIHKKRKKNNIVNKGNMGRYRIQESKIGKHSKYTYDNASYHIKVIFQKFINEFIEYYSNQYTNGMKIKKMCGKLLKKGDKLFNMDLFETKIEDILKSKISSKFTFNKENTNIYLIDNLKSKCDIIKTFCSKTYRECFQEYFLMDNEKFKKKYYESKCLFANIDFKSLEDKIFYSKFVFKFFEYFEKKTPRTTINSE